MTNLIRPIAAIARLKGVVNASKTFANMPKDDREFVEDLRFVMDWLEQCERVKPPVDLWQPFETIPAKTGMEKPTYPRFLIQFGNEGAAIGYYDEYYATGGHGCTDGFAWIEPFSGDPLSLHFSDKPTFWMPIPEKAP